MHGQLPNLIGQSKEIAAKADELVNWLLARLQLLEYFTKSEFTVEAYIDLQNKKSATSDYLRALTAPVNELLYQQILHWRMITAAQEKIMPNMLLSEKTAAVIAEKLPATLKALSAIKGVGPQKTSQYGAALIRLIRTYQSGEEQVSLF